MTGSALETSALLLTDDEALAVAAHGNGSWPSPFPTVDVSSEDAVVDAVSRGWRSLSVRELVVLGEPAAPLDVARRASEGIVFARTFLSERPLVPSSLGSFTTFVASAASATAVMNVATSAGVHAVGEVGLDRARELVHRAATAAFADPQATVDGTPLAFCILGAGSVTTGLSILPGSVTRWASGATGEFVAAPPIKTLEPALREFLDAAFLGGS